MQVWLKQASLNSFHFIYAGIGAEIKFQIIKI